MSPFNRETVPHGPCYKCEERHEACHGHCEKYKAWKADLDRMNDIIYRERKKMDTMSAASKRKIWREKRYARNVRSHSGEER